MKVIVVKKSLKKFLLVELKANDLIKEVAILVARRKNPEAVERVLAEGRLEKEITDSSLKDVDADIIITEDGP